MFVDSSRSPETHEEASATMWNPEPSYACDGMFFNESMLNSLKMAEDLHYSDLIMVGESLCDRIPCTPCDSSSDKEKTRTKWRETQRQTVKRRNRKVPTGGK